MILPSFLLLAATLSLPQGVLSFAPAGGAMFATKSVTSTPLLYRGMEPQLLPPMPSSSSNMPRFHGAIPAKKDYRSSISTASVPLPIPLRSRINDDDIVDAEILGKDMHDRAMFGVNDEDTAIATKKTSSNANAASRTTDIDNNNILAQVFDNIRKLVASPAMKAAAVVLLAVSVLFTPLFSAQAIESGGRMGGSYSSPSRSYSAPSRSMGPSSSYSRGYSRGFSSGYYSSPRISPPVVVAPSYSPFYSPFGWGPRWFGPSPGLTVVSSGPSLFGLFATGAFFLFFLTAVGSLFSGGGGSSSMLMDKTVESALGPGVSVAQISVAVDVPRRDDPGSILSFLQKLSRTARTDSRVGLQNLVSQVALQLLRQKRSIVAASSQYAHYKTNDRAQREFNSLAVRERSKFERETVSKYGGVDYSVERRDSGMSPQGKQISQATVAVVTLVLAIEGDTTKIPPIRSLSDVETALSRIASDAKVDECLQSAEILWTPEERSETLTQRDIMADYPNLRLV